MKLPPTVPGWFEAARASASRELTTEPIVIIDVGAAGAPAPAAAMLASFSSYLGFDPDLRAPQLSGAYGFRSHLVLNKAVTAAPATEVVFNLTRYPECSSLLPPNAVEVSHYTIDRFFDVVGQARVPAVTLPDALVQAGLTRVDWLKLDTQGIDLSLLRSLPPEISSKLLLVDLEPGVSPFYLGEDRLSAVHEHMLANGFWLSDLGLQRFPRLSAAARTQLQLEPSVHEILARSPFAIQLQYARTIEHLEQHGATPRDYVAAWLLAMAHDSTAYALDLAAALVRHGAASIGNELATLTLQHVRSSAARAAPKPWMRWWNLLVPPIVPKAWRNIRRRFSQ